MFYDLHVPWHTNAIEVQHTITFLHELGYNVIALSHTLSGKLPADLTPPIPANLPFTVPARLQVLRRCNLILSDPSQNHRLASLAANYDILALRPTNEKSFQQACQSADCDIISLDLTGRLDFHFKMKMLTQAINRGIKFEICYGPGILTADLNAKRNTISNATQLIRATRGRGIIISSESRRAVGCRGPQDVINLAAIWGLGQERGLEAVSKLARSVTVNARIKRTSFRGVVDIIQKPRGSVETQQAQLDALPVVNGKRKADMVESGNSEVVNARPISKREQKRQRKALLQSSNAGRA